MFFLKPLPLCNMKTFNLLFDLLFFLIVMENKVEDVKTKTKKGK